MAATVTLTTICAPSDDIASDVLGFASEMTRRRILTVKDEG